MPRYTVDVPPHTNPNNSWVEVESFETEAEAIQFVKDNYGGDDQGRISIVSGPHDDDDDDEDFDDEE